MWLFLTTSEAKEYKSSSNSSCALVMLKVKFWPLTTEGIVTSGEHNSSDSSDES